MDPNVGNNDGDAKAALCCGSVPKAGALAWKQVAQTAKHVEAEAEAEKGARLIANTLVCWLHNAVEKCAAAVHVVKQTIL